MRALFSYSKQVPLCLCQCFKVSVESLFCIRQLFCNLDALGKGLRGSKSNSLMCGILCGIFKLSIFLSHKFWLALL